jgi:hypothetical protein
MRALHPVPDGVLDPATRAPRFGSYHGALVCMDLGPLLDGRTRVTRHKRWMYVAVVRPDLYLAVCVVHLGYAANAWAFAFDARTGRLVVDRSILAPAFVCSVGDTASEGCEARIRVGRERIAVTRAAGATVYALDARLRGLEIRARLDSVRAPPAITAIAPLGADRVDVTEKRALLDVTGEAVVAGERRPLDGAIAGYDFTSGIMARRTAWRWAFLLGRAVSGERVAMNLVQGFAGEAECAAWVDGELHPLGEGRFVFDARRPLDPWTVTTADASVDLRFCPGAAHVERRNLGVIASRFVHPIGSFTGTIVAGGRRLVIDGALGVTEDQDVLW